MFFFLPFKVKANSSSSSFKIILTGNKSYAGAKAYSLTLPLISKAAIVHYSPTRLSIKFANIPLFPKANAP